MFLLGTVVRVRATDDFYAYIDGREGRVYGYRSGFLMLECDRDADDLARGKLIFFVPQDQVEAA